VDRKFTSMMFTGSLEQVALAITKAFTNGVYHGKGFFAPPYDFVVKGTQRIAVPLTNAWDLCVPDNGRMPLTLVPAGKTMAAYDESFFIKAEPASTNTTRVSIRTEGAGITTDQYERSPHLNLVLREEPHDPIPSETTNLFLRIEAQLAEIRAGHTSALPPTPDTASGYYLQFWTAMGVKQQHDRQNWRKMVEAWGELQQGHNPQGGANGRQPSGSETNRTSAAAASRRSP
jgi:hypothetical protein